MPIDKLTKAQKAAVLMMALPPEVSVEIMKELDESAPRYIFKYEYYSRHYSSGCRGDS